MWLSCFYKIHREKGARALQVTYLYSFQLLSGKKMAFVGRKVLLFACFSLVALGAVESASAQRVAKYGSDFMADGAGARALGMGAVQIGLVNDVTSVYWNPAGLRHLAFPELAYMHAERFAGMVSFDFGAFALPLDERSTIGISVFRTGVNDIKNTLDAWDGDRPKPNVEDHITSFSVADYAVFATYGRQLSERLAVGASAKIIRRGMGPFADAWGYGVDVGVQYERGALLLGATLRDAIPMMMSWSVNTSAFEQAQATYDDFDLPEGGVEIVLPVLRLGSGYRMGFGGAHVVTAGIDLDVAFDGYSANALSAGDLSFHPRIGAEYIFSDVVAFRAGLGRIAYSDRFGWDIVPSVGTGLRLGQLRLDYAFGDFAGMVSDLGYSHRISAVFAIPSERWGRSTR
jgi:hypothetical protein